MLSPLLRPATWQHLPRESRDTLFLLALCAWLVLPLAWQLPPWVPLASAALLLWRAQLAWRGRPLPRRRTMLALAALVLVATLAEHRSILGRDAGVSFVVLLLALKTLEMHARRDAMVVFFLGFFVLVANFLFSQSLPVAAAMLLALLGLLTALVNAHLPVGRPPLRQSLRLAGQMLLWGTPLTAALFLLFPRVAPLWGLPQDGLSGKSGLSGEMRVGDIASLALDDSVALRLRFLTPGGQPPAQSALYFRGPVLEQFDGREWRQAHARVSEAAALQVQGAPVPYEATLEPLQLPWLLLLDAAPEPPALPEGWRAQRSAAQQWQVQRPITSVLRYQATSYPDFRYGPTHMTPALAALTALPPGSNPRTRALAASLRANLPPGANDNAALVAAALAQLRSGGYRYTLAPGIYGADTADEFWFERKAGFCEHIASAFAVLMRAAGVPARIVTGYQGGDKNPVDGYWSVRQSDAHAWVEVWQEGQGWRRVDPTSAVAPDRIGELARLRPPPTLLGNAMGIVLSPGLAQQLRALWEATNNGWNQWVLNYTQARQLDLLQHLGFSAPSWADLLRLLAGLIGLAGLAGALWAAWERQRRDPWVRLLAQVRQRLARRGIVLAAHLPPRAMAAQLQAQCPPPHPEAEALGAWLLQFERARYAKAGRTPATSLTLLRRQLRRLRWPHRPAPP